jgi:hypothetical protein
MPVTHPVNLANWDGEIRRFKASPVFARPHLQNNRSKTDWRCGPSGTVPALQVRSLKFKPKSPLKETKKKSLKLFAIIFELHCGRKFKAVQILTLCLFLLCFFLRSRRFQDFSLSPVFWDFIIICYHVSLFITLHWTFHYPLVLAILVISENFLLSSFLFCF